MRIAQVAPLFESVPPRQYGGTERVVSYLTEELVRLGHEVTLYATEDSLTSAKLRPLWPHPIRPKSPYELCEIPHLLAMQTILEESDRYDLIHFHIDNLHYPFLKYCDTPNLTTLHGRLDQPHLVPLYKVYSDVPVVSISDNQRTPLPWLNWQATVYHGLPKDLYQPRFKTGKYAAFLGRVSPEKGLERAIEISKRAGIPLKVAAKIGEDAVYFRDHIKPLLDVSPHVEFIGEIGDHEKNEFLGNAAVLLFPIGWPEPFGLVMIEAMACGTPVIAFPCGSVPEIMKQGVSGLIVDNMDEAAASMDKAVALDRKACRSYFEEYFSSELNAKNYLKVYEGLVNEVPLTIRRGLGSWKTSYNTTINFT
jgi:glycosyltransferase involved in cell wall biosynthesis